MGRERVVQAIRSMPAMPGGRAARRRPPRDDFITPRCAIGAHAQWHADAALGGARPDIGDVGIPALVPHIDLGNRELAEIDKIEFDNRCSKVNAGPAWRECGAGPAE